MNTFECAAEFTRPRLGKQIFASLLVIALLFATLPQNLLASQDTQTTAQADQPPTYAPQSPDQLQQLVAPIALYPDSLVAQILAAATFPEQVVEADRWVQAHPDLKDDALAQAVDQQSWDPSVKALTAFPSVLGNMDKNLSWTSSLGDAYYNQQQDVTDAVQVMRQQAQDAGNLRTTPQQKVTKHDNSIEIQPVDPDVVYVPAYDPWVIYGGPIAPWPGWYPYPGIWYGGPYLSFGVGFGIGFYSGFGWGWGNWGFNWRGRYPVYGNNRYYSRSVTYYNRNTYYRGGREAAGRNVDRGGERPVQSNGAFGRNGNGVYNGSGARSKPFEGSTPAARGWGSGSRSEGGQKGLGSGAFSNYDHGGEARDYSSRGSSSFGGGGRGGGGGGGGARGGGRR
jgi:Protein of unknown function (DUF3300)